MRHISAASRSVLCYQLLPQIIHRICIRSHIGVIGVALLPVNRIVPYRTISKLGKSPTFEFNESHKCWRRKARRPPYAMPSLSFLGLETHFAIIQSIWYPQLLLRKEVSSAPQCCKPARTDIPNSNSHAATSVVEDLIYKSGTCWNLHGTATIDKVRHTVPYW